MLAPRDKLWSAPDSVCAKACSLLQLTAQDVVADFGCGDGVALIHAVETYGCRGIGYEIHEERAKKMQDTVQRRGLRITVHACNALDATADEGVNAVYLYLIERGLSMILPVLRRLSSSNGGLLRVVSVLYRIPGLVPEETARVQVSELVRTPIYRYVITPASGLDQQQAQQLPPTLSSANG